MMHQGRSKKWQRTRTLCRALGNHMTKSQTITERQTNNCSANRVSDKHHPYHRPGKNEPHRSILRSRHDRKKPNGAQATSPLTPNQHQVSAKMVSGGTAANLATATWTAGTAVQSQVTNARSQLTRRNLNEWPRSPGLRFLSATFSNTEYVPTKFSPKSVFLHGVYYKCHKIGSYKQCLKITISP